MRLSQAVERFQSTAEAREREQMTNDFTELAASGVSPHDVATELAGLLKSEPATLVKLALLDRLSELDDIDIIFAIASGLEAEQPRKVREAAIDLLENNGDKRAIPLLKKLAADSDAEVAKKAADAADLLNTSGQ
jgi:HEAT repeat protein